MQVALSWLDRHAHGQGVLRGRGSLGVGTMGHLSSDTRVGKMLDASSSLKAASTTCDHSFLGFPPALELWVPPGVGDGAHGSSPKRSELSLVKVRLQA